MESFHSVDYNSKEVGGHISGHLVVIFDLLQSKYKKCPASASVVCYDLLYFVVFFRIIYRLNAIKYIFRTFYH